MNQRYRLQAVIFLVAVCALGAHAADLQRIDPSELNCNFTIPKGSGLSEVIASNGQKRLEGSIGEFICEGKKVELESSKVTNGFLTTKDFGKVQIKVNFASYTAEMFMPPGEKDKLKKWAKGR